MPLTWPDKGPSDTLDHVVNWAPFLGTDTISASTWTIPSGLTKTSDSFTNTTTTAWWRGGVPDVLLGYDTHIITGNLANGAQPGLLLLGVSAATNLHIQPGSHLQLKRIGNSRDNEVGA